MLKMIKRSIRHISQRLGYVVVSAKPGHRASRNTAFPLDFDEAAFNLFRDVKPLFHST